MSKTVQSGRELPAGDGAGRQGGPKRVHRKFAIYCKFATHRKVARDCEVVTHRKLATRWRAENGEWRMVCGMRNHLVHGYGMFDAEIAWDAIETCVPPLRAFCEEHFRPQDEPK